MNKWLRVVVLVLLVLASAMALRRTMDTAVANGGNPVPPTPWLVANGGNPVPPTPWLNGGNPVPPTPWKNGGNPVPPTPWKK